MSTLATLRDDTRRNLKIDPGKNIWTDSELEAYLNEAVTLMYAKLNFKFEWEDGTINPLVAAQANYTRPTDLRRILWAKLVDTTAADTGADESELKLITDTLVDFQRTHDMDADNDTPGYLYEEAGELWIYPVPTAAAAAKYTVKYKYSEQPATLIDSDTPAFTSNWHFVLEWYAKYKAWDKKQTL